MTQVSFTFPRSFPYFRFQVPFHLLFLPSWQNHKVDMLQWSAKEGVGDEKEVEGVAGRAQQKLEFRGIKTTCQSLIYYKRVWFDSISVHLTQGSEKLATSPTYFSVVNLYVYFLAVFFKSKWLINSRQMWMVYTLIKQSIYFY